MLQLLIFAGAGFVFKYLTLKGSNNNSIAPTATTTNNNTTAPTITNTNMPVNNDVNTSTQSGINLIDNETGR